MAPQTSKLSPSSSALRHENQKPQHPHTRLPHLKNSPHQTSILHISASRISFAPSTATITSLAPHKRKPAALTMATSQFPSRPFTGLGRASTVGQQQQQQQVPNQQQNLQQQQHQQQPPQNTSAYPVPSYAGPSNTYNGGAGAAGPGQRDAVARSERERLERERREAEERAGALEALSEEQREEINEAVRTIPSPLLTTNTLPNHQYPSTPPTPPPITSKTKDKETRRRIKILISKPHQTVLPLRPRQRQPHRLPRIKSRPQSPRLRPSKTRPLVPPLHPRHPCLRPFHHHHHQQQTNLLRSHPPPPPPFLFPLHRRNTHPLPRPPRRNLESVRLIRYRWKRRHQFGRFEEGG